MTIDNAVNWLKLQKKPYWRLMYRSRPVAKFPQEEDEDKDKEVSLDASIQFFEESIELMSDGKYTLIAKSSAKGNRGEIEFNFDKNSGSPSTPVAVSGMPEQRQSEERIDLHKQIEELKFLIQKKDLENQLKEKENKIKHLKNSSGNARWEALGNAIVNSLSEKLQPLLSGGQKSAEATKAVSGVQQENEATEGNEAEVRVEQALSKLHGAAGEQFVPGLERLAAMAEENPEQFKSMLNMLGG